MATDYLIKWRELHLNDAVKSSVFINNSSKYNRVLNELSNVYFDEYFEDKSLNKRYLSEYNIMTPSRERLVKSWEVGSWFFEFGIFTSDKRIVQDGRKSHKINFIGRRKKGFKRNKRQRKIRENRKKVKYIVCEWFKAKEDGLYNASTHDIEDIFNYLELGRFDYELLYTLVVSDVTKEMLIKYDMKRTTLYSKRNKLLDKIYVEMDLTNFF